MKRIFIPLVFVTCGILCCGENALAVQDTIPIGSKIFDQTSSITDACSSSGEAPVWPLQVLTKDEREARLRYFIPVQQFQLRVNRNVDAGTCNKVLKKLETFDDVQVLEAKYKYSNQEMTSPVVESVVRSCQNLTIDKIYYSHKKGVLNSKTEEGFDSKSESEKNAIADGYSQVSANMEMYDLSPYLGEGTWGYLGEAMLLHCKKYDDRSCTERTGYSKYAGSLGIVFNNKNCKVISDAPVRGQRITIGIVSYSPAAPKKYYTENPSFISFVTIDGTPYRIDFRGPSRWNNFMELSQSSSAELYVYPISNDNDKKQLCLFTSKNFPKLESNKRDRIKRSK